MKAKKKGKILVAMSGGVDSSVAAALLVKAGYDVTGVFMVNYDAEVNGKSCWHADYQDALRVAAKLKIPLLRLDFVKEYKKLVLDYTFKSYSVGRTPNPDILCNKFVKFGAWLEKAKKLGFDKLATGHYARITCHPRESGDPVAGLCHPDATPSGGHPWVKNRDLCRLIYSKDTNKDQTYFLHQLSQMQLSRILFPIGNYTKPQVRALAKKFNLPTAEKEESMGICFVGEMPMREFLKGKVKAKAGKIISTTGEVLGKHDGLPFYTIGERVGNLSFRAKPRNPLSSTTAPLFVIEKNTKNNTLIVGLNDDPALFKQEVVVSSVNWLAGQTLKLPLKCKVRLRHRQELQDCVITVCHSERGLKADEKSPLQRDRDFSPPATGIRNDNLIIKFAKPQRAITPGQFAVFYLKGECLGGGEMR